MEIDKIIPPLDYKHRNGFSNIELINKLTKEEKGDLENILINKLNFIEDKDFDSLIIETLAYLKSRKALPILKELIITCANDMDKLIIASSIFEIDKKSTDMIDIAIKLFKNIDNKSDAYYVYKLVSAFYYLSKFKNSKINNIIKEYTVHPEYLVSYNAKKALLQHI